MVNKAILIGNVGRDPEVREFDGGSKVANFSLATTERGYTTRDGKVVDEKTEWHNITCWGGLAGVVEKYVNKGDRLYIEGKLRTRKYTDKDGVDKYATEINVDTLQMLGGGKSSGNSDYTASPAPSSNNPDDEDLPF